MNVILNSGYVVKGVQLADKTRSPVGLFVWATKQAHDQILTFDKLSIKCSQIAGIELEEGEYFPESTYQKQPQGRPNHQSQHQSQHDKIDIKDDDLPF